MIQSGENIQLVTRAVKQCIENGRSASIDAKNEENAQNLAGLIDWLGYGKLVYCQVQKADKWQVVVVKK